MDPRLRGNGPVPVFVEMALIPGETATPARTVLPVEIIAPARARSRMAVRSAARNEPGRK